MTECWIFDIDKTLADNRWRDALLPKSGTRTAHFVKYNKACVKDKPIENMIALLNSVRASGFKVVLVTGRSVESEPETRAWLGANGIQFDALHMRGENDNRDAVAIKADLFEKVSESHTILGAFDDDPQLVAGLSRLGYNMILVGINQTCRRRNTSLRRRSFLK